MVNAERVPDVDWNALCHVTCSDLLGGITPNEESEAITVLSQPERLNSLVWNDCVSQWLEKTCMH